MQVVQALLGLTFVAWLVCESEQFGFNMGPYDILMQQVYLCEDQGTGKANLNISLYLGPPDATKKKTRPRLHRGSFSWPFTKEEAEAIDVEMDAYQKKTNDYLLMHAYKDNFCTATKLGGKIYSSLLDAIGIKVGGCALPGGNYAFNDWNIPLSLPVPMLEYGSYKATIRLLSNGKVFGCFTGLADVKPKT